MSGDERSRTVSAWVSLGSNLGSRRQLMAAAIDGLDQLPGTTVAEVSSLYETPPWGDTEQGAFLNAVARLDTRLEALALLEALLSLEQALGRRRDSGRRWGPRLIDIDLLLYGDGFRCATDTLELPHPRLAERAFVLVPLVELSPREPVPGFGTAQDQLSTLDTGGIVRVASADWFKT